MRPTTTRLQGSRPGRRDEGFTLVELLVSLLLLSMLLVAALVLFDFNSRVARVQTHVADMQQNLRVSQDELVRTVRMAGRGGLMDALEVDRGDPATIPPAAEETWNTFPNGIAVSVRQNAADDETILVGVDSPDVVEFTDVLTVRGFITTPILMVNYQDPANFTVDPAAVGGPKGTITVRSVTTSGLVQKLKPLADSIADGRPEALLIVSAVNDEDYAVVELVPGDSIVDDFGNPTVITAAFRFPADPSVDSRMASYIRLSPKQTYPSTLTTAASVGILEEYRFFVRERTSDEFSSDGAGTADLQPSLARLRTFPNREEAYANESAVDVADNILDLQVAMGIDTNGDNAVDEAAPGDSGADFAADEWLGNHWDDDPDDARWELPVNRLFYVRVNLLARTDRRDPDYTSPPIVKIEDSEYAEERVPDTERNRRDRLFRRRLLSTVVDLRNLS